LDGDLVVDLGSAKLVVNGANVLFLPVHHDQDLPRVTAVLGDSAVLRAAESVRIDVRLGCGKFGLLVEIVNDNFMRSAGLQVLCKSSALSLLRG
jgi:hypothetical protein